MSYKVACTVVGESKPAYNALRFETEGEADAYGRDLFGRWLMLRDFEVETSDDPATHAVVNGIMLRVED
jgi:hypothetical protein